MSEIKPINKSSVHHICSGQVILDLTTAVKELVENSLDAGAKSVEVKLKEYGLDQVEVIDNGTGVEENNFQALTLKHHTSKLRDFSDLVSVQTFGFRGEALSSLCALCDVIIQTRHRNSAVGYKLEFDHDGVIKQKTKLARQIGTTVLLSNLFKTLPVRQKEFKRNIKKEYTKLLNVMSAYCLISTSSRISCSNQTSKGQRVVVLSTQVGSSYEQNISSLFTSKQLKDLIRFKQLEPSEQVCEEYNLNYKEAQEVCSSYKITGYISGACNQTGRSSPDRQFLFINSRPVDLPKVAKVINQIYHQRLNRHQYPFVMLNIAMERSKVDVNVTPNKRKVFVEHEKLLLAIIKSSLLDVYVDDQRDVSSLNNSKHNTSQQQLGFMKNLDLNQSVASDTSVVDNISGDFQPSIKTKPTSSTNKSDFLAAFRRMSNVNKTTTSTSVKKRPASYLYDDEVKQKKIHSFSIATITAAAHRRNNPPPVIDDDEDVPLVPKSKENDATDDAATLDDLTPAKTAKDDVELVTSSPISRHPRQNADVMTSPNIRDDGESLRHKENVVTSRAQESSTEDQQQVVKEKTVEPRPIWTMHGIPPTQLSPIRKEDEEGNDVIYDDVQACNGEDDDHFVKQVPFSLDKLRQFVSRTKATKETSCDDKPAASSCSFRAKIQPSQNGSAEQELTRNLSKSSFNFMEPLGQFNLGFIIARLGSDLFIVDQHASDEIYNFEKLQETTNIHQQTLVIPKKLNLSAPEKMILNENKWIFERNGFDFINRVEEDRDVIYLSKVPMSGNMEFGSEDIDEMIFMLSDSSGVMCRPSRIRKMFASRACRKSVMIGTALSEREMVRLLRHMADIERPWNCPHGRPTMRHLVDLKRISHASK